MTNFSPQEIYDLVSLFFIENGLPAPRSIWTFTDVFSKELIEKGIYKNMCKIIIYVKIEGKESVSFSIEAIDPDDLKKKLNHIIVNELKFLQS